MSSSASRPWLPYLTTFFVALVMLVAGLGRFGVWQPSEVRMADAARNAPVQLPAQSDQDTEHGPPPAPRGGQRETAELQARPPLQLAVVRAGFNSLGNSEWGGRAPSALLAVLATLALAFAVGRSVDPRTGAFVGITYASLPLVFMNARQMLGWGTAQSITTLFFSALVLAIWGGTSSVLEPGTAEEDDESLELRSNPPARNWQFAWLGVSLVLGLLTVQAAGCMLGLVPVVLGVGLAALLRWQDEFDFNRSVGVVLSLLGAVVLVLVAAAAVKPSTAYSALTGAGPWAHAPSTLPTYDALIEHIGHAVFPWTGLAGFGVVRLLATPPTKGAVVGPEGTVLSVRDAWRESGLRLAAFGMLTVGFGLQSFFLQQYGPVPFIAVAPIAVGTGLLLRDAEREQQPFRIIVAAATFFTLIMMRDYLLFPKSSYAALALPDGGPAFPSGFTGTLRDWFKAHGAKGFFEIFTGNAPGEIYFLLESLPFILLGLAPLFQGAGEVKYISLRTPIAALKDIQDFYRGELKQVEAHGPVGPISLSRALANFRITLAAIVLVFEIIAFFAVYSPSLTTPFRVAAYGLMALPLVVLGAVYTVVFLWNFFAWLGQPKSVAMKLLGTRIGLVQLVAVVSSLVIAQLYIPALSEHLSPRGVWAVIRQMRTAIEPVGRLGAGGDDRGTNYYADFEVRDIPNEAAAVDWLKDRSVRHYLLVGSDAFPSLNRAYRRSYPEGERQNVPVVDATNSNLYVAASLAPARGSRNPLDEVVRSTDWLTNGNNDHWHPHGRKENSEFIAEPARLDDKLEYVGYNLDSAGKPYVPVGDSFRINLHFRVLKEITANYQVFIHLDGQCPRINGDHEPAGGKYPIRHWLTGDYIHDDVKLTIPGYCRAGRYWIYMGFFEGDNRMRITGGDHDRENRVVAAIINVR